MSKGSTGPSHRHRHKRRGWTTDDTALMMQMRAAGKLHIEIAAALNRPVSTISNRFSMLRKADGTLREKLRETADAHPAPPAELRACPRPASPAELWQRAMQRSAGAF